MFKLKITIMHNQLLKLAIGALLLIRCASNDQSTETTTCSGVSLSFANDVYPVIKASCATNSGCHGTGSKQGPGELLTYSEVYGARGEIKSSVSSGKMPEGSTLSSNDKNTILCWIENGATNN
jgi:hypothetical protein